MKGFMANSLAVGRWAASGHTGGSMSPADVRTDLHGRPLRNLRLSVTDRCNLRCAYCMPEEEYTWLPKRDILSFEEIARLVEVFSDLGVDRVRLTGGEPLLRRDLHELIRLVRANPKVRDLAMTTNGLRLAEQAEDLFEAGLSRVTVSLDSLDPDVFEHLTRRRELDRALEGLAAAARIWPGQLKIDTVLMRGVNDGELDALLGLGRELGAEVRFIEYMDVGGATRWSMDDVVPRTEILERLERSQGRCEPVREQSSAPADRYRLPDGTVFGIISSTTQPFCGSCDRSRLTADGMWYLCLYAQVGIDLRTPLRAGTSVAELGQRIAAIWGGREDRGAEQRLAQEDRAPLAEGDSLRNDPHLEMHTRGGVRVQVCVVTPAPRGSRSGNRVTALRWALMLRSLGHSVRMAERWDGRPCDLLVALHATKSGTSIRAWRAADPAAPLIVGATGTDVYADLPHGNETADALRLANRIVVLQPAALRELPEDVRDVARVVYQSSPRRERAAFDEAGFQVCFLGHLREVKDPFLLAEAVRRLPDTSRLQVVAAGATLDPGAREHAERESRENPRYRWVGALPHREALRLLARSRLLALTSRCEGGANVISEALAAGVPVISTRIGGTTGLLGDDYPGLFPPGDAAACAELLTRAETEPAFLAELEERCAARAALLEPEREREAWRALLRELFPEEVAEVG